MADLIVNLNFIPINLNGDKILGQTLAKEVGTLLCESIGSSYSLEKYIFGKELYETGSATFVNTESQDTISIIAYFKNLCNMYPYWSNEIKGQILEQFN